MIHMEITTETIDIKPIILGFFTILIFNVLSIFPMLLSHSFMLVPSLVFLAPLPPASIFLGILITLTFAKKQRKRQIIYMILVLQFFLFILNLVRFDAPRPLLTTQYQGTTGGLYMLISLTTSTPIYIFFGVFTAWAYEKLFGKYLKKRQSDNEDALRKP